MSNLFLELGSPPPLGTVLVFKLLADEIAPPEGVDAPAGSTVLWKLVASSLNEPGTNTNPQLVVEQLDSWPQGFAFAFTIGGHELHSVLHTAMSLARYMGFDSPIRDMNPNDPLVSALPDLQHILQAVRPSAENGGQVGSDSSSPWSQQTGLRAPINHHSYPAPWFLQELLQKMGVAPQEKLELTPGALAPLTPKIAPAVVAKKAATRQTAAKKAATIRPPAQKKTTKKAKAVATA